MRVAPFLAAAVAALVGVAEARSPQHVGRSLPSYQDPRERAADRQAMGMMQARATNTSEPLQHLTDKTKSECAPRGDDRRGTTSSRGGRRRVD